MTEYQDVTMSGQKQYTKKMTKRIKGCPEWFECPSLKTEVESDLVTDTTTFSDEARRAEADARLYETCTTSLQYLVDVVSDYHKPFPELLTKLLDFLGGFIRRNHPSLACKHTGRTCGEAVMGRTAESLNREFKQQTTTELGWNAAVAPPAQEMRRMHELKKTNSDPMMVPVVQEIDPYLEKAWSVAY